MRIVVGMLVMAAERLGYDGITLVPSHFHVAAQARRLFRFLDPADEAMFLALEPTRGSRDSSSPVISIAVEVWRIEREDDVLLSLLVDREGEGRLNPGRSSGCWKRR